MMVLDLYCGAGGASMGIVQAGHTVKGIDLYEQLEYPFEFYRDNAIDYMYYLIESDQIDFYDAIFASPPCQRYSYATTQWKNEGRDYPDLISQTREVLEKTGKPFVIENVVGSPLRKDLVLCGQMFNLNVRRHRVFEIHGFEVPQIKHEKHIGRVGDGRVVSVFGHGGGKRYNHCSSDINIWREAMGIDWMSRKTITQAIPPAYTKYIFGYLK